MSKALHVFETAMGWVAIMGADGMISELRLPNACRKEAVDAALEGNGGDYVETDNDFSGQAYDITTYFDGNPVQFDFALDLSSGSDFDRRVWSAARDIPYGQVKTYGELAARIGITGGARAVGQSLGRNPVPIIVPCHRVVQAGGGLGGFSCGIDWKIRLLDLEGIQSPRIMNGR